QGSDPVSRQTGAVKREKMDREKNVKVTKIRRDDRGHALSDEPVRMPKENLYYKSDGYIPQENMNYGRREEPSFSLPRLSDMMEPLEDSVFDASLSDPSMPDLSEEAEDFSNAADLTVSADDYEEDAGIVGEAVPFQPDFSFVPDFGFEEPQTADWEEEGTEPVMSVSAEDYNDDSWDYDREDDTGWNRNFVPPEPEDAPKKKKSRLPAILGWAVCLLLAAGLSAAAGIWIALWDTQKTFTEAKSVINGTYMEERTEAILEEMRLAEAEEPEAVQVEVMEETGTSAEEAEGDGEEEPEESLEDPDTPHPELASVGTIVEAGNSDEIVFDSASAGNAGAGADGTLNAYAPDENYPLPMGKVEDDYFADALFVGDSRLQGFGMYSGLQSTYYCVTSFSIYKYDTMAVVQTPTGKVPIFDALPFDTFTKIYIKVGLNEMGMDDASFLAKYAEMIEKLRIYEPRAIIYVHAILPVTAKKSASDKYHNNPNIAARNEALKQFALEQKAYFIDAGPAVSVEDGSLNPESTADGVHLKPQYMGPWLEYLKENAVLWDGK
ncbi:MAG: hypothetical protein K6G83_10000, partial [Lachnospiraceae bacterium]|nr:hypothetical protein [Lachnospiraceae bacterium]